MHVSIQVSIQPFLFVAIGVVVMLTVSAWCIHLLNPPANPLVALVVVAAEGSSAVSLSNTAAAGGACSAGIGGWVLICSDIVGLNACLWMKDVVSR
jgi:hypothetical protein